MGGGGCERGQLVVVVRDKATGQEEAGGAESQSVSAPRSESEETASLKGPASAGLIRQKWKKG